MKRFMSLSCLCSVFFVLLCSFVSYSYAQEKVVTLRFSNFLFAQAQNSILAEQWCKEVEKRTNGRIKINIFHGGTLTPPPQVYDGVVKGISDVGMSVGAYRKGKFPLTGLVELPLGYQTGYIATKLVNEYYEKFRPKEFDDVQVMYLSAHAPGVLVSKKPVYKLEDLKGMKVRATSASEKLVVALVRCLGAHMLAYFFEPNQFCWIFWCHILNQVWNKTNFAYGLFLSLLIEEKPLRESAMPYPILMCS